MRGNKENKMGNLKEDLKNELKEARKSIYEIRLFLKEMEFKGLSELDGETVEYNKGYMQGILRMCGRIEDCLNRPNQEFLTKIEDGFYQ